MSFNRTKGSAMLALLLLLPLAACDTGTDAEFGSMSILLTDAVDDEVTEAWVTITDIYLQEESGEMDPENSRVPLMEDAEETVELTSLANQVSGLVHGVTVPAGTYDQLRLVISDGCIVVNDGSAETIYRSSPGYDWCDPDEGEPSYATLHMPSYAQSGAKILLHHYEVTNGEHSILLDFDVSESYGRLAGNSGMWVMHPVIHWAEVSLTGAAEVTLSAGEVELPGETGLDDFSATLTPTEGDPKTEAFAYNDTDDVYEVLFDFLIPDNGPFEIELMAPEGLTVTVDPASPQIVEPGSGETVTVDWTLQSATVEGGGS